MSYPMTFQQQTPYMSNPLTGQTIQNLDEIPTTMDAFLASMEKRAYRMAYISLQDRDEALDAVQDTMMRMFQKYSDKPPQEWRPLFYRILNNRITDSHRGNQVKQRLFMWFGRSKSTNDSQSNDQTDAVDLVGSRSGEQPLHQLQSNESIVVLEKAINGLPLRQQQAFLLRHWEGLSTEETAKAMGVTGGSVKTHLSRAMSALQSSLEAHYEHYE